MKTRNDELVFFFETSISRENSKNLLSPAPSFNSPSLSNSFQRLRRRPVPQAHARDRGSHLALRDQDPARLFGRSSSPLCPALRRLGGLDRDRPRLEAAQGRSERRQLLEFCRPRRGPRRVARLRHPLPAAAGGFLRGLSRSSRGWR